MRGWRGSSAFVLCVVLGSCTQGSQATLAHSAESITSLASEGAVLGRNLVAGRVTRRFAIQHGLDLQGLMSDQMAVLDEMTAPPGERSQVEALRAITHRAASDLRRLTETGADQATLATDLERAATAAEKVRGSP